jgi:hypothetical protein
VVGTGAVVEGVDAVSSFGVAVPELIGVILEAIAREGGADQPKKVVAGWFKGLTLSNGWVIDQHLADAMATIARSVALMKGGNRWQRPNP